jgi:thiamine biosynthesis lipoprotein
MMRRRAFVAGSLLAAASALGSALLRRRRAPAAAGAGPAADAERMPDGRLLVRGAALAFGTVVSVAVVHESLGAARTAIGEALSRVRFVDGLMTVFREESQVGRLNAAGALSHPDPHLVTVLSFAQRLSALSDGAFDVTVQPLWLLHRDCQRRGRLPTREEIAAARALVGWRALEVSPRRIALGRRGMGITLNGIAQGYAADLAIAALRERGVADALVDSGEHGAEGARQAGAPWRVGIQHPRDPAALLGSVAMDGRFLAVSGDYASAFSDDLAHHHLFDPRSGLSPAGLSSVAVAAASGMEADALTKPVMVLARGEAEALLGRFPGAGALWMDKRGRAVASRHLEVT